MLDDQDTRPGSGKRIAVVTQSAAFTDMLVALLELWGFVICDASDSSVLLLAEAGSTVPVVGQDTIWLNTETDGAELGFSLPLDPERFWQALEQRFHNPPRRHIRLEVEIPAEVGTGGEAFAAVLTSLSDMGCRYSFHREQVRGEALCFRFAIEGETLEVEGEVIYSMPASAVSEGEARAGAVFRGIDPVQRDHIRALLIGRYLEMVCERMLPDDFVEALSHLDLPPAVREALVKTATS